MVAYGTGCADNTACLAGEYCDTAATRICVAHECQSASANPCAPGHYCAPTGDCTADCRSSAAVACAAHTYCSLQTGLCEPARSLVLTTDETAGSNCPFGGLRIEVGVDDNNNGALDPTEVTDTSYVCKDGNKLVATANLPAGDTTCPHGGVAIKTGVDVNGDSTLQDAEVQTTRYVCDGANGDIGPRGPEGSGCSAVAGGPSAFLVLLGLLARRWRRTA